MNQLSNWQDTIVALATPAGIGALGIIRLSGANALGITDRIFRGKKLSDQQSHTLHFGTIKNANDEVVDEVVVSVYKKGRSFTGEESTEIACHGSPYIIDTIIRLCITEGARLAAPGEFTQRAFLNGRMDLAQAEAVADLIAAENKASHHIALNQMRGGISNELHQLRDQLIHFTALVELELDFAEEDVEFADRAALYELISNLKSQISNLISTFEYGNAIKKGVPVAIIGMPNAGKSTLLNALLKEERAIVSDIAGTTRDVIEEAIVLDGITFRFIDTAGIRETGDTIEAIGVARAKEKVQQADVIIHLYEKDHHLLDQLEDSLKGKLVFNLVSKTDVNDWAIDRYSAHLKTAYPQYHHFGISVRTGFNLDRLVRELVDHYKTNMAASAVIITNARHKEALVNTLQALEQVEQGMQQQLSGDLLAFHLRDALRYLGSITGQIETDRDILGAIFSKFCIGK